MINMSNFIKIVFFGLIFVSQSVLSQSLIPATTEDQDVFDQQLEQATKQPDLQENKKEKTVSTTAVTPKTHKSNFGSAVMTEAKKIKIGRASCRERV